MVKKISEIIFSNSENSFVYYILPTFLSLLSILLIWIILITAAYIIKVKSEKWKQLKYNASSIRQLVVTQKSLIRKSLTSFRRVIAVYILLTLSSHILDTFSNQLKDSSLKLSLNLRADNKAINSIANYSNKASIFLDSFSSILLNVFFTILIAIWVIRIAQKALDIFVSAPSQDSANVQTVRNLAKQNNLNSMINHILKFIISIIATFTILQNLGINLGALLATAGVASLAIGFGAQSLIKDLIAGFFILFEDQFTIGDGVEINTTSGTFSGGIEKMTLHMTRLRCNEGSLLSISNGDIRSVKNYTTDWSRIDFKFALDLNTNLEKAFPIFKEEVERLCKDFSSDIVESPDIRPMEKIENHEQKSSTVSFRFFLKTTDVSKKVHIETEFNRRLIQRFKQEKIL